jgi:RHS repeat-associated protein
MLSYATPFSGYTFAYNVRNRLAVSSVGAIGTTHLINGLGQRVSKSIAGVPQLTFAYDEAGHLTGKYDGNGNLLQETVWLGDLPVAVLQPAAQFYIAPDHLGAPHQITNASGQVAWLWDHDPFGNGDPSDPLGNFTDNLRFPGQFFDQNTKLHYNYFRDYDPSLGRYIESDPIGLAGGINTYAYAGGNPVNFIDPSGLTHYDVPLGVPVNTTAGYTAYSRTPGTVEFYAPGTYPNGDPFQTSTQSGEKITLPDGSTFTNTGTAGDVYGHLELKKSKYCRINTSVKLTSNGQSYTGSNIGPINELPGY